jgi:hypothetical protein
MSTKYIKSLAGIKKNYKNLYDNIKEVFKNEGKNMKNFDLDYFAINSETNEFYLSMTSFAHSIDSNESFDMRGEILEDEIAIFEQSFSCQDSGEDLYNTERSSYYEDDDETDD